MRRIYSVLKRIILGKMSISAWKEFEYFEDYWKDRISKMASIIERETSILDLGCGQYLKVEDLLFFRIKL